MADFYPVLKRAIGALPSNTGEARRAVYERARSALVRQLQAYDPPLSPAQITDQRLALEESIRRVESEVAGAAFGLTPETPPAPADPRPEPAKAPPPRPEPARPEPPKAEAPRAEPAKAAPPPVAPPRPADGEGGKAVLDRMRQETASIGGAAASAVRAMRDKLDETSELVPAERIEPKLNPGEAAKAAPAARSEAAKPETARAETTRPEAKPETRQEAARQENAKSERRPAETGRTEPTLGAATGGAASAPAVDPVRAAPEAPRRERPPVPPEPRGSSGRGRRVAVFAVLALLVAAALGAVAGMQAGVVPDVLGIARQPVTAEPETGAAPPAETTPPAAENGLEPKITDRLPQEGVPPAVAPDARAVPTQRVTPPLDEDSLTGDGAAAPEAATPAPVAPETAAPDVVTPPAATPETPAPETPPPETAPPETPPAETPPAGNSTEAPASDTPATAEAQAAPGAAPEAGTQPAVIVAQRSILYEEPVAGSEGTRLEGEAIWSFTDTPPAGGGAAEPAIRAEVSIPERGLRLALTIRKNADAALPASHLVDLAFTVEPSFTGRAIGATPGLIMKQTEDARGDPLVGAVAPVSENLFWLALSSTERDLERNLGLLKEREWIDVPIRYADRRRAILTFEKGTPGRRAFEQAMAAWGQ